MAVGYDDAPHVSISRRASVSLPIAEAQTGDLKQGDLASVAWSSDGATLTAGGQAQASFAGEWRIILRRFGRDGRRLGDDIPVASNMIMDIQRCGDGFVFARGGPGLRAADVGRQGDDLRGRARRTCEASSATFSRSSDDGATVRFGLGHGAGSRSSSTCSRARLTTSATRPRGFA